MNLIGTQEVGRSNQINEFKKERFSLSPDDWANMVLIVEINMLLLDKFII